MDCFWDNSYWFKKIIAKVTYIIRVRKQRSRDHSRDWVKLNKIRFLLITLMFWIAFWNFVRKILILGGYSGLFLRLEDTKIMFQTLAHLPSYHQKILDRNDVPVTDMCIEGTPMPEISTERLFFQTSRETTSVPSFFSDFQPRITFCYLNPCYLHSRWNFI